jgi:TfoX/Sxy family transcriptional regulator of competence genes
MATDQDIIDFIVDQVAEAGFITSRKMFGEYALYCNLKVVGLVCDNQLYIKPTDAGKAFVGEGFNMGSPYEGAKPMFLIEDKLDDRRWISELVRITADELPEPKPKKPKKPKKA